MSTMDDWPVVGRWKSKGAAGTMDSWPVAGRWKEETDEEREEREFLEYHRKRQRGALLPNIEAGAIQMTSGMAGLAQRITGGFLGDPEETARYARAAGQAAEEEAAKPGKVLPEWAARGVRSVTGTMPTQVMAGLTGGPPAMIGLAASQEMNQAIFEGREAGLKGVDLAAHVVTQGIIEAAPAAIMSGAGRGGFEAIFGKTANQAITRGIKAGLKKAGIRTIEELAEENITELGHNVADVISGVDPKATTWARTGKTVADTTVATLMQMGLAGAPGVARAAMDRGEAEAAPGEPQVAPSRAEWLARNRERLMAETQPQQPPKAAPEATSQAIGESEGFTFHDPTQEEREQAATQEGVVEALPEDKTIALTKAEGKQIREDLGQPELPGAGTETHQSVMDEVAETKADEKALTVARNVLSMPRPTTTREHASFVVAVGKLLNERENIKADRATAVERGNTAAFSETIRQEGDNLRDLDILTAAGDRAGSELGRALNIRKLRLSREKFDIASVLQEMQSVKESGVRLTEKEKQSAANFVDRYAKALEEMATVEQQIEAEEAVKEMAVAEKVIDANKPKRKAGKTIREKAIAEREDIKKQIRAMGYRVHDVSGVTIEGTYLIGRLGLTYVKEGAGTLAEVSELLRADMPQLNLTQSEVNKALIQRSPKWKAQAKSEANERKSKLLSIAREQVKVEDLAQNISSEVTGRPAVDPELAKWRKMRRALERRLGLEEKLKQAQEGIFPKKAKRPAESPVTIVINAEIRELKKRANWTQKLEQAEKGEFPPESKKLVKSPEVAEMQKRYKDLLQLKKLTKKVELAERGIFEPKKPRRPLEENIKELGKRFTKLRNEFYYSDMEAAKVERAILTINHLQDQLKNGLTSYKKNPKVVPQQLAGLHEDTRQLRTEVRVDRELAEIRKQKETGNFPEPVVREKKVVNPRLERKQIELAKLRREKQQMIINAAPWTKMKMTREGIYTLKAIKATADISFTFRQNVWHVLSHPIRTSKAFIPASKAFFSEYSSEQIANALRNGKNAFLYEQSGVAILDANSPDAQQQSEVFRGRIVERIPVVGAVMKASSRHAVAIGNLVRTSAFDQFMANNPNATLDERRAFADYLNVTTGLGNLSRAGAIGKELDLVFFAPRFAVSRVQTPYVIAKYWKKYPRVRAQMARDMTGFVATGGMVLTLAAMAGAEVELFDPDDPDWGKIRFGDTRIDIWGGFQQPARVIARIAAGPLNAEVGFSPLEVVARFAAFKFGPAITLPHELWTAKTAVGEDVTRMETMAKAVVPLVFEDIWEAWKLEGVPTAAATAALAIPGVGVSTYRDSETVTRKKFKKLWQAGQITKARQLRYRWNQANPDDKIVTVKVGGAPRK